MVFVSINSSLSGVAVLGTRYAAPDILVVVDLPGISYPGKKMDDFKYKACLVPRVPSTAESVASYSFYSFYSLYRNLSLGLCSTLPGIHTILSPVLEA